MHIFKLHDTDEAGVTVGNPPHEVRISSLEYADDAGLLDETTEQASTRVTAIANGSRDDAAMEISIPKTKSMHIHKRINVSETTEQDISKMGFEHVCPNCERDFPTKRGLAIHMGRWCDGGATVRSRKGSLADKKVQHQKRKVLESERKCVTISGHKLENVYSFEYLGSRLQCDGDDKADVDHRMSIAQTIFSSLSHIWSDHRLSTNMKIRLYRTAVCSAFTHACEAWNFSDPIRKSINGFNSRCLSHITGKDLRNSASHPEFDLVAAVIMRRLRFAGHILRMNPERLLHRSFIAYLNSRKTRPPGSLLHGFDSMSIQDLTDLAHDRKAWNRHMKSLDL